MARLEDKIIITTALKATNKPVSRFFESDFRDAIVKQGYEVLLEKAIKCSCKSRNSEFLSDCRNCGGTGWIFVNPEKTRMVIQSMSLNPKYESWGVMGAELNSITALPENKLSYMDKVTIMGALSEHSEVLHPLKYNLADTELYTYSIYPIIDIYYIGVFEGSSTKLKKLEKDDYRIENRNKIILNQSIFTTDEEPRFSMRYSHNPAYYILDMVRDSMLARINTGRTDTQIQMPIHARAKRIDLFKDKENYTGDRLLDNSFKIC